MSEKSTTLPPANTQIWLPKELLKEAHRHASLLGITLDECITRLIEDAIKHSWRGAFQKGQQ